MVGCMVVMPVPRDRWTDEKLDKAFGRIDGDLSELRVEMRKGFEQMDSRFERVENQLDSMQRNMILGLITLNATIIGGLLAIHP
jgi:hypothetical protein